MQSTIWGIDEIENFQFIGMRQLLFHSKRDLKKDFLKGIHKKQF